MYAHVLPLNLPKIITAQKYASFVTSAEYISKWKLRELLKFGTRWGYNQVLNEDFQF